MRSFENKSKPGFSSSLMEIGSGLANVTAVLTAVHVVIRTYELADFGVAVVFRCDYWHRQFSLSSISSFHDFRYSQSAMMGWHIWLLAIGRRLDWSKSGRWLMLQREVMQSWKLNTVVEVLWA